ncbi:MAG TPA: clostripain-related cysteine peptidase, partial [Anaerolineae bacterium]|nr:clostripain-related cysteine peptidase [Anaerolineae bacterium]
MRQRQTVQPILSLQPVAVPAAATSSTSPRGRHLFAGSGGSGDDKKKTVRAERRRRVEPAAPGGRERAEAPSRRKAEPQRPTAGSSGGATSRPTSQARPTARPSGGTALPSLPIGRLSPILIVGLLIVACVCIGGFFLLSGGLGGGDDLEDVGFATRPPAVVEPTRPAATTMPARPTNTPRPFVPPSTSGGDSTWLVMLYQDADDKILEQDIYVDLNEAERVGSSDQVHVVAQMDRFRGGYQGDGNWSSARRYYVTQDTDLNRVNSELVEDLGEVNMSDGETLVDFVTWAVETFPADKHVLILSDHGMGWPGGWSDADSSARINSSIPLASRLGDELYLHELDEALQAIRDRTGIDQFEMIGLDACLMGHVEVFAALAPHARYAVASQETEPALGWAYTSFLDTLVRNPGVDGAGLGQLIVDSYIDDDQRIVDDQARAELLRGGSPMGGLFGGLFGAPTAAQLAQQMGQSITLTAVDLAAIPELIERIDELAYVLQGADQAPVARARTYAQNFTSVWGKEVPPSYLDLGSLVQLLERESGSGDVRQAAGDVLAAIDGAVIAEKHGSKKPGATGISIYFPNSQLYGSPLTGPESYTAIAERFAGASLWDDFLAYHYAGRRFERDAAELTIPEAGAVRAAVVEEISLSSLTVSDDVAAPGAPVLLSADVEGDNVGYAYLFVGYYDPVGNSIQVVDRDYLESGETRESDGIYYPVWPEGGFTL